MLLPRLPEDGNARQRAQLRGRVGRLHRVEEGIPVLAHCLGIGLTLRELAGQSGILNPFAIALIPRQRGDPLEPGRCARGDRVQGGPQRLRHEFQAREYTDRRQDMGRVGTLLLPGLEQPHRPTALQQVVEEQRVGTPGLQAVPELTEHGKVEAWNP